MMLPVKLNLLLYDVYVFLQLLPITIIPRPIYIFYPTLMIVVIEITERELRLNRYKGTQVSDVIRSTYLIEHFNSIFQHTLFNIHCTVNTR